MTDTPEPITWVDGDPVTVGDLNREVRDALRFLVSGVHCTALLSADQTIPDSTITPIVWGNIIDDTDDIIAEPSDTFTFARDGMIALRLTGTFAADSGGVRREFSAWVNGVRIGTVADSTSDTNRISGNLAIDFPVAAGDTLVIQAYHAATHSLNVDYTATQLCLGWVGKIEGWDNPDVAPPDPTPDPSGGGGGGTPAPRTPVKHTNTYWSTWSRSYASNNSTRWDDPRNCYQGYADSFNGNNRSLVGFDSSAIVNELKGASRITMHLKFYVNHCWYYSGSTIVIGMHKNGSKPGTWVNSDVYQNIQRMHAVPGKSYSVTLSSTIINGLKSGQYKGISFGPGNSGGYIYYALINGALNGNKPKIDVVYYK